MIITEEEWLAMRQEWEAQLEDWLSCASNLPNNNPYCYATSRDGVHHPCDDPGLEPHDFLLADHYIYGIVSRCILETPVFGSPPAHCPHPLPGVPRTHSHSCARKSGICRWYKNAGGWLRLLLHGHSTHPPSHLAIPFWPGASLAAILDFTRHRHTRPATVSSNPVPTCTHRTIQNRCRRFSDGKL